MAKELLEDAVLKPVSISLNPNVLRKFDEKVGRDQRSKAIRELIRKYIKADDQCTEDTLSSTGKV